MSLSFVRHALDKPSLRSISRSGDGQGRGVCCHVDSLHSIQLACVLTSWLPASSGLISPLFYVSNGHDLVVTKHLCQANNISIF